MFKTDSPESVSYKKSFVHKQELALGQQRLIILSKKRV
jgi:hypothetical protein